jgi:hypothetical protein
LREWWFAIGAAFSGVVGVGFILLWEIVFGVVWLPMAAILGYNNVYQNLESLLTEVNVYRVKLLYCAKWELMYVVMQKAKILFVPLVGCGICAAMYACVEVRK